MRPSVIVLFLITLVGGAPVTVRAETFGGWQFTSPSGFTTTASGDHVEFMRITAPTFCQLALYAARPMSQAPAAEAAFEWKNVVEKMFQATEIKRLGRGKSRSALPYEATGAAVRTANGDAFYAILYVVTPAKVVSSVLVLSNTADTIAGCDGVVKAFLDSLTVEGTPAPPPSAPPGVSPAGRWATSVAGNPNDGSPSIRRQYTLAGDGTYRYHSETWGGAYRPDEWMIIDEVGRYAVAGDKLTIDPTSAKGVIRSKQAVKKTIDVPLEKVTYDWRLHYFAGIQESNLVLRPPAKTRRDGEFALSDQFPSSYLLSAKYEPDWQFPP